MKGCYLGVCIVDDAIKSSVQFIVTAGQDPATVALPGPERPCWSVGFQSYFHHIWKQSNEQILYHLIGPKAEATSRTFHDGLWTQSAEDARFIVLTWVQIGERGVVGSRQACLASRTHALVARGTSETSAMTAVDTEYMTLLQMSEQCSKTAYSQILPACCHQGLPAQLSPAFGVIALECVLHLLVELSRKRRKFLKEDHCNCCKRLEVEVGKLVLSGQLK